MNFVKRGLLSIWRKPGKSVTLLLLIFVLGNVIAGAISVKEAIRNTQKVMIEKIGIICKIGLDEEQLNDYYSNGSKGDSKEDPLEIESLTADIVDSVGQSSYVKYYDYFTSMWLDSVGLEAYVGENGPSDPVLRGSADKGEYAVSFQFTGGQNPLISAFVQGKATLYQGRVFTADEMSGISNVVLISKNLADTNNLSVGSVIRFKRDIYNYEKMKTEIIKDASSGTSGDTSGGTNDGTVVVAPDAYDPGIAETLDFEFTVIGIFEPKKTTVIGEDGKPQEVASVLENVIYASNSTINDCNDRIAAAEIEVNGSDSGYYYTTVDPMFVLNSPEDLDAFIAEATPKLPNFYKITDNSVEFETVSAPMTNMGWIAGIVLYVAISATLLILSLLITLFLRDRKHEMGIYLSLGERKAKVAGQVLIEVMMIAVVAITLSLFTGNIIAKNMSGQMLENQIIAEQQNGDDIIYPVKTDIYYPGYYSDSSMSSQDLIDSYKVTLDGGTILLFYLCGIGTVMLSTLIPITYTLRLNPKKILM